MQRESLGRIAGDFIGYVAYFRDAPETSRPSPHDLRSQLRSRIDQISSHPSARHIDPTELEQARFALAAWADEVVLSSDWSYRDEWPKALLQNDLFGTNRGGDEFYDRLQALTPDRVQAREVFFLCLVHGFQGRLAGDDAARYELVRELYESLRVAGLAKDASDERYLTRAAYMLEIDRESSGGGGALAILLTWLGGTLILVGLLFLVLWFLAGGVDSPPEF